MLAHDLHRTRAGLLAACAALACEEGGDLWLTPPAAPPGAQTVFHAVSQGDRSLLWVHAVPAPEPLHLPLELDPEAPARVQVIFTPLSLSQLALSAGVPQAASAPTTTLAALEHEVWELDPSAGAPSGWRRASLKEPALSLPLAPDLCPEFEFEPLSREASFVVAAHANRAGLVGPDGVVWYKWKDGRIETEVVPLELGPLPRSMGWFESDNAIWIGNTSLSRLILNPQNLIVHADLGTRAVRDFLFQGDATEPRGLLLTNDGAVSRLEGDVVTELGHIPTRETREHTNGGFAEVTREERVFAAISGAATVLQYAAGQLSVDPISTNDTEGFSFGATTANLGPILVSRPQGELYRRTPEQRWSFRVRLGARARRVSDFGDGAVFFLADRDFLYYSDRTGPCGLVAGPWGAGAHGAPVGRLLLVSSPGDEGLGPTWLVHMRMPD